MDVTTALHRRDAAKSRLNDLYARAAEFGMTSEAINAEYNDIKKSVGKAPRWVFAYLDGCRDLLTDLAYRHHLVYGAFIDGKFYSTHRNREDYYEKHGLSPQMFCELRKNHQGHYWQKNLKPFYVSD